ncbi:pilus assembly FimT family protein [Gordonibacter sp.]|uniref:pilus assembly FimT family protein n=1 Tax=Gordonibacter sp. TaxID=1968902 RepID=UPI002FC6FA36
MFDRSKNNKGFTLTELLLAIAIILVLTAIAIPSVANAQKNMHMLELDSAANQIALAAQNQMTSMKVSGTWLEKLKNFEESGGVNLSNQPIKCPPNNREELKRDDLYYLTATQVRELGILPSLSIDETVLEGDYVIEFSKSTATVCGVFYSDNKVGFFGKGEKGSIPVENYYKAMGDTPASDETGPRSKARRMSGAEGFLIGYYWGTPAGATGAVALANPNIWVENGKLCIQDSNLKTPAWGNELIIKITNENNERPGSFTLSFQPVNGQISSFNAGLTVDQSEPFIQSSAKDAVIIVTERGSEVSSPTGDVLRIDLNALGEALSGAKNPDLVKEIEKFKSLDAILVNVETAAKNASSVPARAEAHIQWPESLLKINVLVTSSNVEGYKDPNNDGALATERTKTETGTGTTRKEFKPVSVLTSKFEEPVIYPANSESQLIAPISNTAASLKKSDWSADAQTYSGLWVDYNQAVAMQARLGIQPGNTMSKRLENEKRIVHYFQPYEIWVNNTLIGHFDGIQWQWDVANHNFIVGKDDRPLDVIPTLSAASPSIYVNPASLEGNAEVKPDKDGYTLLVRTGPLVAEVQSFFDSKQWQEVITWVASGTSVSSRSLGWEDVSYQSTFLNEFRVSSSAVLWSAKKGNMTGIEGKGFSANDLYFYYAPTPRDPQKNQVKNATLSSSVLWRYTPQANYSARSTYMAVGQNLEGDPRLSAVGAIARPETALVGSADFGIAIDLDYLYYRTFTYYDDENKLLDNEQWMPLLGFDVVNQQYNSGEMLAEGQNKSSTTLFKEWNTQINGTGLSFPSKESLGVFQGTMPFGNVKLFGQYQEAGIGLMYLEFDEPELQGGVSGYYGYTNIASYPVSNLGEYYDAKNAIGSWGYFVVVPEGMSVSGNEIRKGDRRKVIIEGTSFDAYPVRVSNEQRKQVNMTVEVHTGNIYASYKINPCFAAAVESVGGLETGMADQWGQAQAPWLIRHATQFPGTFPRSYQYIYVQEYQFYFAQTRDIDAQDRPTYNSNYGDLYTKHDVNVKFDYMFTGTYDGAGLTGDTGVRNKVVNFRYWIGSYASSNQGQGLFPRTQNATIKNLILEDSAGGSWNASQTTSGAYANFGILVGYAGSTQIISCSVSGQSQDAGPLEIHATNGGGCAGSLVGVAQGDTFVYRGVSKEGQKCSIDSIRLYFTCSRGSWQNAGYIMGGVAGKMETPGFIQDTSVSSTTLGTPSPSNTKKYCVGGLAGWTSTPYEISSGNSVSSSTAEFGFVAPTDPLDYFNIGTAVGYMQSPSTIDEGVFSLDAAWTDQTLPVARVVGNL